MNYIIKLSIFVLAILSFVSCQKVIDLPVSDEEPKLVIEARYNANKAEVWTRVSKSVNVYSTKEYPIITGANVVITDENGNSTQLIDQGDGTYLLENYSPIYNSEYLLTVEIEGETHHASDSLLNPVPLDSIVPEFQESTPFLESGYVIFNYFKDPLGPSYYRLNRKVNGENRDEAADLFLFDDQLTDGNAQKVPIFAELFQEEDTVKVEFITYSEKSYNYYIQLRDVAVGSGASAAPANPTSSWSSKALGHFTAFAYDADSVIVGQ